MSRISSKSLSSYPWYLRLLFYFQKRKYKKPLEPAFLWGRIPGIFLGFLFMQKSLNRKRSPINPLLRALISTRVSQLNQCEFCIDMNASLILQRGGSEDKFDNLASFRQSMLFTDVEKAALEYAEAITQSSNRLTDEYFKKMKEHFDEDSIVEITALIAFQNLSSKFNSALDAKEFGFCQISHKRKSN